LLALFYALSLPLSLAMPVLLPLPPLKEFFSHCIIDHSVILISLNNISPLEVAPWRNYIIYFVQESRFHVSLPA